MVVLDLLPRRGLNVLGFLACLGALAFGFYFQFYRGLEPCPLCILQRLAFVATGLLFLLAAVQGAGRIGSRVYGILILVAAGVGAGIAARQVWLQHLPPGQAPDCGPGLDYMLEVFPLTETLRMVFTGSGECAEVQWTFLGLSIPNWSLLLFLLLALVGFLRNNFGRE